MFLTVKLCSFLRCILSSDTLQLEIDFQAHYKCNSAAIIDYRFFCHKKNRIIFFCGPALVFWVIKTQRVMVSWVTSALSIIKFQCTERIVSSLQIMVYQMTGPHFLCISYTIIFYCVTVWEAYCRNKQGLRIGRSYIIRQPLPW